ncbi:MAG: type II toxin-antitoxin system VapC family toxin, partial [Chloroflexia bacterium]|nr:type II toxin-antitoxin system VapC family toxin [Chloroflexia bacterium]
IDTHIFLWWLFDDDRLPVKIKEYIQDINHPVYVSSGSVWEIATKFRLGKLPEAASVAMNAPEWIIKAGFQPLDITPEHAQLAGAWGIAHRDPFDRMLAAQSKLENLTVASVDVNDHPNGATHDRLNGAISSWPKSGFRTGFKLVQTSVFHPLSKCRFSMISDR